MPYNLIQKLDVANRYGLDDGMRQSSDVSFTSELTVATLQCQLHTRLHSGQSAGTIATFHCMEILSDLVLPGRAPRRVRHVRSYTVDLSTWPHNPR